MSTHSPSTFYDHFDLSFYAVLNRVLEQFSPLAAVSPLSPQYLDCASWPALSLDQLSMVERLFKWKSELCSSWRASPGLGESRFLQLIDPERTQEELVYPSWESQSLERELVSAIYERGLVCLVGRRRSGKSTLLRRALRRIQQDHWRRYQETAGRRHSEVGEESLGEALCPARLSPGGRGGRGREAAREEERVDLLSSASFGDAHSVPGGRLEEGGPPAEREGRGETGRMDGGYGGGFLEGEDNLCESGEEACLFEDDARMPADELPILTIYLSCLQTQSPLGLFKKLHQELEKACCGEVNPQAPRTTSFTEGRTGRSGLYSRLEKSYQDYCEGRQEEEADAALMVAKSGVSGFMSTLCMAEECLRQALKVRRVVVVLEEFDLLAEGRQTFLYSLIEFLNFEQQEENKWSDRRSRPSAGASVVAVTSNLNFYSLLESRIASRFPSRNILMSAPNGLRFGLMMVLEHLMILPIFGVQLDDGGDFEARWARMEQSSADIRCDMEPSYVGQDAEAAESHKACFRTCNSSCPIFLSCPTFPPSHLLEYFPDVPLEKLQLFQFARLWNAHLVHLFWHLSPRLAQVFASLNDLTACHAGLFKLFRVAVSMLSNHPRNCFLSEKVILEAYEQMALDGKVGLLCTCTTLQLALLAEMVCLESRIQLGLEIEQGLVEIDMKSRGEKSCSSQRLKFYTFENVFAEFKRFVDSDPSLAPLKHGKVICEKAFEGLLRMRLVAFAHPSKYRQMTDCVEARMKENYAFQRQRSIKVCVTTEQLEAALRKCRVQELVIQRLRL